MLAKLGSHLVGLLVVCSLSTTALAQNVAVAPGFGIEGGIGYFALEGDDFLGVDAGVGFEGTARYTLPSGLQFVGGVSYNVHDVGNNSLDVLGIFAEPRYLYRLKSPSVAPFFGARISYLYSTFDATDPDITADGWAFGGVGGILFQVDRHFGIELSVLFAAVNFGDVEAGGVTVDNTDASGSTLGLKLGIVVNFPRDSE